MAEQNTQKTKKPRIGRNTKLTEETHHLIVGAIVRGAYDYIAAEAAGVSDRTFRNWMERGENSRSGIYHNFYAAVVQARARARATAETEVFATDPYRWLRFGPGRDRKDRPGWGEQVQITGDDAGPIDVVLRTRWGRGAEMPPPTTTEKKELLARENVEEPTPTIRVTFGTLAEADADGE